MRKVSELPSTSPVKYVYCIYCDESFENDTHRDRVYCFQHGQPIEMYCFYDRDDLDNFLLQRDQREKSVTSSSDDAVALENFKKIMDSGLTVPPFPNNIVD